MHGEALEVASPLQDTRADPPAVSTSWDLRSRVTFCLACAFAAGTMTFVVFALTRPH
jgi:hypothetical protein